MRQTFTCRFGGALAVATLTAAVLVAQSGPGQQNPPQTDAPPQQPIFRAGTNFVRVDVYPTRKGQPVQGLTREDFELLEDGMPQKIEAFEHVVITPAGPQAERREPSSQRDSLQQAENPRSRVFVIFLDLGHVSVSGSHQIKEPIIRLINQIVGPDDLMGIMTTDMSTSNITLARKTEVLEQQLRDNWIWGRRFSLVLDDRENAYVACYPVLPCDPPGRLYSALAEKMIQRKRERESLEALQDLVRWLGSIREERKAVITITEGWVRVGPDDEMMRLRECRNYKESIPGPDVIMVGPTGKLTTRDERDFDPDSLTKRECDTDRMRLSMMDNRQFFLELVHDANRANTSFYPVDPRGLAAFDYPIGPESPPPVALDQAILRTRHETMHDLALSTDGMAVMNNNDLDVGLKRIADDLTSYYLLGYYSTNTKMDGRFRRLQVRVKQPGVDVRARRGYRAPTQEEVLAAKAAAEPPSGTAGSSAFSSALGSLGRIRPDATFRLNAAALAAPGGSIVWVAGELLPAATRDTLSTGVATAAVDVKAATASGTATVKLAAGERGFVVPVKLDGVVEGTVQVRVRVASDSSAVPMSDAIDVAVGPTPRQPLLFRRGPSTGNKVVPAADFRFLRTERLRAELPVAEGWTSKGARLLDKAGTALQVPVTVGEREEAETGQRWITGELTLAPLAAGDYVLEFTIAQGDATHQVLTGIRVTR